MWEVCNRFRFLTDEARRSRGGDHGSGANDKGVMNMDLREFVHGALKDVVLAIEDAQKEERIGQYIAPELIGGHQFPANSGVSHSSRFISTVMQFDVAVTAERGKTGGGTAGIRIAVVEAKLGGEAETKDTTVSRIRFSVPILMPRRSSASSPTGAGVA
jgi:hypothetical protein